MVIADASGLPVAVRTDSARPHEVKLVQATINEIVTVGRPGRSIGDRAHDSDPLDEALAYKELNSSRRIARIAKNQRRKTDAPYAGTKGDGKLNAFLRGLTNSKKQ